MVHSLGVLLDTTLLESQVAAEIWSAFAQLSGVSTASVPESVRFNLGLVLIDLDFFLGSPNWSS